MKFASVIYACGVARRALGELRRDHRGGSSVLLALLLPAMTTFVGLGAEIGLWFYDQRAEQGAADAAAFTAAYHYKTLAPVATGDTAAVAQSSENQSFAVAANYGYGGVSSCAGNPQGGNTCLAPPGCNINAPGTGATCVAINNPPLRGTQTNNAAAFEVVIAHSPAQLLSKMLRSQPVVIKARSVGQMQTTTTTSGTGAGATITSYSAELAK